MAKFHCQISVIKVSELCNIVIFVVCERKLIAKVSATNNLCHNVINLISYLYLPSFTSQATCLSEKSKVNTFHLEKPLRPNWLDLAVKYVNANQRS